MRNQFACISRSQSLQRHPVAKFFFFHPCKQCLLHNPAARTFQLRGKLIDPLSQSRGHMRSHHPGFRCRCDL